MNRTGVRWLFGALAIGLLVASLSGPRFTTAVDPELARITDLKPEAFMEGVHQRLYDEDGYLESTRVAASLLDFGDRADAELEQPKLWLERPPATWYLEGNTGTLSGDRNTVRLHTDVLAIREQPGSEPWTLSGETLLWDQTTDLVTSDTTTTLVQGTSESIGDSLVMNLQTSEYTLGDNVRTQWQRKPSSQSR